MPTGQARAAHSDTRLLLRMMPETLCSRVTCLRQVTDSDQDTLVGVSLDGVEVGVSEPCVVDVGA